MTGGHGVDLISRSTRGHFRDLMTGSTVGAISTAFQDEGFAPDPDCSYEDSSVRRVTAQAYMESVDWTDLGHIGRAVRVFERLLDGWDHDYSKGFRRSLAKDGYHLDVESGEIVQTRRRISVGSLSGLRDPAAILEGLDRIGHAVVDDPALAVGSAKELAESTAKVVLIECSLPVDDKARFPALISEAQRALGLHPQSQAAGPDGTDAVRKILGGLMTLTSGLDELRNRGYGTGHGAAGKRVGLGPRHARLAVNAATTWCQLMLETLADERAPWRQVRDAAAKVERPGL